MLIKFAPLEFAKSFREGTIYMNSLDYFRGIEDEGVRGDIFEGTHSLIANKDIGQLLAPHGMDISEEFQKNIIGGMSLLSEELKYFKVFCMYKLGYKLEKKLIETIDKRISDFGNTFVLITDFNEFKSRVNNELEKGNYEIYDFGAQEVSYYQYDQPTQELGPFAKSAAYSWQKEFRLIASPLEPTLKPLVLNVGDLSDISIIGSTDRLIQELKFSDNDQLIIPGFDSIDEV